MRGISHPSIVKLYSFAESPEHYFLVVEGMQNIRRGNVVVVGCDGVGSWAVVMSVRS